MIERKPIAHFDKEILGLMRLLRFRHNKISINGSSTIRQLFFFADIDMFSPLKKEYSAKELFNGLKNILFKIRHNSKCYFLELKIQLRNGDKIKIFPNGEQLELNSLETNLDKIDFIKIDIAYFLHFRFIEVSCIYQVGKIQSNIKNSLKSDIQKYSEEKKYFKMLKRYFSLFNLLGKTEKADKLINFFNSKIGFYYVILANIETIELIETYYKDHLTKERVNINLKMLNLSRNNLEAQKQDIEQEVNREALNFFSLNVK